MSSKQYSYRVIWSEEDLEFVGLCAEFPSLSWLAGSQEEALRGIINLVEKREDLRQDGVAAYREYKRISLHLINADVKEWVGQLRLGKKVPMPKPRI